MTIMRRVPKAVEFTSAFEPIPDVECFPAQAVSVANDPTSDVERSLLL